jgi:hypothetical protein
VGSKASGLESSGAHKASEGPGVYLHWGVGFQEPQQLLQGQGTQDCRQQEPWGLLAGANY